MDIEDIWVQRDMKEALRLFLGMDVPRKIDFARFLAGGGSGDMEAIVQALQASYDLGVEDACESGAHPGRER